MRESKLSEYIKHNGRVVGIVLRAERTVDGTKFITKDEYPLQIGIHSSNSKKIFSKHRHGTTKLKNKIEKHEVILVQSGKLSISFFDDSESLIAKKILKQGDVILIMDVTHQVTAYSNSKIVEIKQGPYDKK